MALVICPDCGSRVSSEAPACLKCGHPIASLKRTQKENSPQLSALDAKVPSVLALFLIGLVVWGIFSLTAGSVTSMQDEDATPRTLYGPPPSKAEESRSGNSFVRAGDDGYVKINGALAARSEASLARAKQLAIARDAIGLGAMEAAGEITLLNRGDQVKMLDAGFITSEVRIMEGPWFGRSAFVDADSIGKR